MAGPDPARRPAAGAHGHDPLVWVGSGFGLGLVVVTTGFGLGFGFGFVVLVDGLVVAVPGRAVLRETLVRRGFGFFVAALRTCVPDGVGVGTAVSASSAGASPEEPAWAFAASLRCVSWAASAAATPVAPSAPAVRAPVRTETMRRDRSRSRAVEYLTPPTLGHSG